MLGLILVLKDLLLHYYMFYTFKKYSCAVIFWKLRNCITHLCGQNHFDFYFFFEHFYFPELTFPNMWCSCGKIIIKHLVNRSYFVEGLTCLLFPKLKIYWVWKYVHYSKMFSLFKTHQSFRIYLFFVNELKEKNTINISLLLDSIQTDFLSL